MENDQSITIHEKMVDLWLTRFYNDLINIKKRKEDEGETNSPSYHALIKAIRIKKDELGID